MDKLPDGVVITKNSDISTWLCSSPFFPGEEFEAKTAPDLLRENRELKEELKKAHSCMQNISDFINKHTDLSLGAGKLIDFEKWKQLLIKVIVF